MQYLRESGIYLEKIWRVIVLQTWCFYPNSIWQSCFFKCDLVSCFIQYFFFLWRYAYTVWSYWHFVDFDQFWVIFSGLVLVASWEIKKPNTSKKIYESKTSGLLFGYQDAVTKWYYVIVPLSLPQRYYVLHVHRNVFRFC